MILNRALFCIAIAWLVLVGRAWAGEAPWIEVTGYASQNSKTDSDAARRHALADALFNAALAGGADVRGHTVVSKSVVTSDLTIVRAVGRVLEHKILSQSQVNGLWSVTIAARVGLGGDAFCQSPRRLLVSAYAPEITVSPHAPAWAEELAQQVAADLVDQLDRHPATDMVRITQRHLPVGKRNESLDYVALTQGTVRLQPGELGFVPVLHLEAASDGYGPGVALEAELQLHSTDGGVYRQSFRREVSERKPLLLGRLAELTRRDRQAMSKQLTAGLKDTFTNLLNVKSCEPLVAALGVQGGKLSVPVGRKNGLSRAALAFTIDRDNSTQLLEVVSLSSNSATLRPLDPGLSAKSLAGRQVRFVEAAW
jgi:hypothetical protein